MTTADDITYCEKHPTREATLRCIRCNRLMCTTCALPTPTGYICRECTRRQEDRFYQVERFDYARVIGISLAGNMIACMIALLLNVWWIGLFIGGAVGSVAATLARRSTGRRVGRYSARAAIAGAIIGACLAPILWAGLRFGVFTLDIGLLVRVVGLTGLVCTLGFAAAVYATYQRRI